jgi:hypothetical protein
MTPAQSEELIAILQARFENNPHRHPKITWASVQSKLEANAEKLQALNQMEATGGQPDVVDHNEQNGEFTFMDCAPESPNRRSLCYDNEALESRKEHKPKSSAITTAKTMGIEVLSEDEYRHLQSLGEFDLKTSSWLKTPQEVRDLGGAIFGDRRFNRVFTYHNGAESYYASRGFRGSLKI